MNYIIIKKNVVKITYRMALMQAARCKDDNRMALMQAARCKDDNRMALMQAARCKDDTSHMHGRDPKEVEARVTRGHNNNSRWSNLCKLYHSFKQYDAIMQQVIHMWSDETFTIVKHLKKKKIIQIKNIWYFNVYIHKLKLSIKYFNLNITVTSHAEKVSIFTRQISDTRLSRHW